jgi:group I intron endonuclease
MISMLRFSCYASGIVDGPKKITSCGIYGIYCEGNGLWYVGKSVNIMHRMQDHFKALVDGVHKNKYLQRSFAKYGMPSFTFFSLDLCSKENASEFEIMWIQRLNCFHKGFNLTQGGDGGVHCEETKNKIRRALLGKPRPAFSKEWRDKMSQSQMNRTHPQEVKDKISKSLKGRVFTEAWRKNLVIGKRLAREKRDALIKSVCSGATGLEVGEE